MEELLALLGKGAEKETGPIAEAGARLSEEAFSAMGMKLPVEELAGKAAPRLLESGQPTRIFEVNKSGFLGGGDEGDVFSNGDGTVTKVFHDVNADLSKTTGIYDRLRGLQINVPDTIDAGKTIEGQPALKFQQVGDGDHLQTQLMLGQVPRHEMPSLLQQYDQMAKTLQDNRLRVDWQLKNMTWDKGKLYLLDPSYLKEEPLSQLSIDRMRPRF